MIKSIDAVLTGKDKYFTKESFENYLILLFHN